MPRYNFYAVAVGREIGVVSDWDTCLKHVDKYPGNKYAGFNTKQEAENYVAANRQPETLSQAQTPTFGTPVKQTQASKFTIPVKQEDSNTFIASVKQQPISQISPPPAQTLHTLNLVEMLHVVVDYHGSYKHTAPHKKHDVSSRVIRVAATLDIPSTYFAHVTFSNTPSHIVSQILMHGITLDNNIYFFVGYTNSGIKKPGKPQAWFIRQTQTIQNPQDLWIHLGDFSEPSRQGAAKLGSRLGLSFAGSISTIELHKHEYTVLDDITAQDGTILTDGCGEISPEKQTQIATSLGLSATPAAIQMRYLGFKGMLVVNHKLPKDNVHVIFRRSMHKFATDNVNYHKIDVLNWSEDSSARLSSQIIRCLLARAVPASFFETLFDKQLAIAINALKDASHAIEFLRLYGKLPVVAPLIEMLAAGFEPQSEPYLKQQLIKLQHKYLSNEGPITKLHMRHARNAIGVYDPSGDLPAGQVYFERKGKDPLVSTILICKHPMYHPGDIRKVEAVDVPALRGLQDVLVFSRHINTTSSLPNMCSGSDLDGDQYFICHDPELVRLVSENIAPYAYQNLPKLETRDPIPMEQQLSSIVAHYQDFLENNTIGKLDKCFIINSELSETGIASKECMDLVYSIQICLDSAKTGFMPRISTLKFDENDIPHYLGGKRHSTSVFGYFHDQISKARASINYTANVVQIDPHLQFSRDDQYLEYLQLAKQAYSAYKYEVKTIKQYFEATEDIKLSKSFKELYGSQQFYSEMSQQITTVCEKYRTQLIMSKNMFARCKMANAIYEVVYQRAAEEANSHTTSEYSMKNNKFPFSFVWNVAGPVICLLKANALAEENGSMAPFTVAPQRKALLRL